MNEYNYNNNMTHRTGYSKDEAQVPRCCSGGTRRSRSIAIKRKLRTNSPYDETGDATAYEIATWRMYNRIVSHRMSHQTSDGSSSSDEDNTLPAAEFRGPSPTPRTVSDRSPTKFNQDAELQPWTTTADDNDEGIFQLDL